MQRRVCFHHSSSFSLEIPVVSLGFPMFSLEIHVVLLGFAAFSLENYVVLLGFHRFSLEIHVVLLGFTRFSLEFHMVSLGFPSGLNPGTWGLGTGSGSFPKPIAAPGCYFSFTNPYHLSQKVT